MKRRKEVVGSAVAKGARLGGGEAVPARGRTLRARQERGAASEGDRDAAQAVGQVVAQASRDAQELAQARPITVTYRRRQKRSRPGVRVCEDSVADKGPGGHTRDLLFSGRQGQAESLRTARRPLSAAQQPHRRRSGGVVDALCATDADRECLSLVEKRVRCPSHLSYHQLEHRADAHILIAFLAYCLQVTLKNRLMIYAPGLTPAAVLEKLATIQMVEVWIPMLDGRWLMLPRHTQPEKDVQAVLDHIQITLPAQPPPRIKASQVALLPPPEAADQPSLW